MSDVFDALKSKDRRLVRRMAEATGKSIDQQLALIVGAYSDLVQGAPDALPNDPLRKLTARHLKTMGGR